MIYFIRSGRYVKIGYTQDEQRFKLRLRSLQCGNPETLSVEALMNHGGPRTEKALHEALAPWRHGGEWFIAAATPVKHVLKAAKAGKPPVEVVKVAQDSAARSQAFRVKKWGSERPALRGGRT